MAITEAEGIKKRWQEYTEELYKKDLHDPDNHNSMITHLDPDILEWKVKSALWRSEKRKDKRGKGEKKRYTHLNKEFQRISRSNKKAFLSDQCKDIEEYKRMGKTRDHFMKIRYIKEILLLHK